MLKMRKSEKKQEDGLRKARKRIREVETMKKDKGITLIALVITIIVLLILAGVSIAMLTGENGILNQANNAKTQSALAEEKEKVELAAVAAKTANKGGEIKEEDLIKELDNNLGNGKYQIQAGQNEAGEEGWIVTGESGTKYFVSKDGKVEEQTPSEPVEIPEGLGIGSKVTYTPEAGTYKWEAEYCSSTKEIGTDDVMLNNEDANYKITNWRVFSIDERTGEVELVPTGPTEGTVYLEGAQGYNNAVKLLNDACGSLYSDSGKGITARSMNIEDIEKKMTKEGLESVHEYFSNGIKYGNQVTRQYSKSYSWFPSIYEQEKYRAIDKEANIREETGLNLSEQKELIGRTESGTTDGGKQAKTSIQPTLTYWYENYYGMQKELKEENGINYIGLIMPRGSGTTYWLASRCIGPNGSSFSCTFYVRSVRSNGVSASTMYYSHNSTYNNSLALFPVVSLSSELLVSDGADGFTVK